MRSDAKEAIASLKAQGIEPELITSDTKQTAKRIAEEVGIEKFYARCLPEEKVKHLQQLQQTKRKPVAMIGDGINDAPALATASIGTTMGAGSDVAIVTGDVVLVKNHLFPLTKTIQLAKRMNRIIKQNIIFSVSVIVLLILANIFQVLTLPLGGDRP